MKRGFIVWCIGLTLFGQSQITGPAIVSLIEAGPICQGHGVEIHILADVAGLMGSNGDPVGINSFVIEIQLDRGDAYASSFRGSDPALNWGFHQTDTMLIQLTHSAVITGWVGNTQAPNQLYHLGTLYLAGTAGPVQIHIVDADLGSRVVNGNGPSKIPVTLPAPLTTTLPESYPLTIGEGAGAWLGTSGSYDVTDPAGIDTLDFVTIVNCGG